jgi:MGT family glycosyltransferase
MNQCIALATELAGRGHSVLFATQAEGRDWLRHPRIEYVRWEPSAPGDGGGLARHLGAVRGRASAQSNWFQSQALIVGDLADSYAAVYTSLDGLLRDIEPELLIVPQTLAPAIDLAHHTKRRLIIQTAFLPKAVRLHASVTMPDPRSQATWRQRIESVWGFVKLARATRRLERARRAHSGEPLQYFPAGELLRRTTIVAMSDPSLEAGATFTPNVHLVGPLIPRPLPALPAATLRFIEQQAPTGLVFVAFGTLVTLDSRQIRSLAEGLADCGAAVLWALPERLHRQVRSIAAGFHLETFVPQMTILSNPAVRAFVSHAGANSAIEGMYWGRPILALPFMLDQHYYAGRVVDLSAGIQLNPRAFTSHDVRQAIGRLLHDRAFGDAAARLAQCLQRTPGLTGAADIVEMELSP